MRRASVIVAAMLYASASVPAVADAPRAKLPPVQTICTGTPGDGACATIDRRARRTSVHGRHAPRALLWSMASAPDFAVLSPNGRFLVEEHRAGGLIDRGDGPSTQVLVVRDRGRVIRQVTLADLGIDPNKLPQTASHRIWSRMNYFADAARYVVMLSDGREISLDLTQRTPSSNSD